MMIEAIIKKPIITLAAIVAIVAALSTYIQYINVDASPDSLLLESDPDLEYYREIHREYGTDEYIIVGFEPKGGLYTQETIAFISELTNQLQEITGVSSVSSATNVPLLQQTYRDANKGITSFRNLTTPDVNIERAQKEFSTSPLYAENLVSDNSRTTAIKVDIQKNETLVSLLKQKYEVLDQIDTAPANESSLVNTLDNLNKEIPIQRALINDRYKDVLTATREIIAQHKAQGSFYLAGAPLLAHDIKTFVNSDIKIFGLSIISIMLIVLFIFFRKVSWVLLALSCAFLNVFLVAGLIGLLRFQLTIISANFVALLIIFSITLSIHVIIRYLEVSAKNPGNNKLNLIEAIKQIVTPCAYMVATSAIAFFSLIVSDIQPVINFGLIMIIGLFCAFFLTFTVLPALIKLINPVVDVEKEGKPSMFLASILDVVMNNKAISTISLLAIFALSIFGISNITVENRFIDYFKSNTDIYQGLILIDRKLGGTVPLEVLLEAPEPVEEKFIDADDEFADYLEEAEEDNFTQQSYWYNRRGIHKVRKIHEFLENLDQVGKVLSISSTEKVFRQVNKGEELEDFHLAVVYKKIPENIKNVLISPYVSRDGSQARILARIKDSDKTLIRNDLLNKISAEINEKYVAPGESMRLSGISVLYNNVLQSLYRSQILTLGTVFICILLMLLVLFRNFTLAIIGTLPNVFTALFILGAMGLLKIPLDIMTITIAAITIGIGVDYAIHYIHRFKKEVNNTGDYLEAIKTVQVTVGKALYYTSVTITLGFIILVSSSFKPSIYFGLFTSIAMIVSLLATFTIIPLLMNLLRPIKVSAH